jgi:hypothetical protein
MYPGALIDFEAQGLAKLGQTLKASAVKLHKKAEKNLEYVRNGNADKKREIEALGKQIDQLERKNVEVLKRARVKMESLNKLKQKAENSIAQCKGKKPKHDEKLKAMMDQPVNVSAQDTERGIAQMAKEMQLSPEETAAIRAAMLSK